MNLEGIAAFLESKRQGVRGVDIFVNEMPAECELGLVLRDRYSGTPIDDELPGYRDTGFRLAVRSRDFAQGKKLATAIFNTLYLKTETQMEGMLVKRLVPLYEPRPYRKSKGGYWEWELDFQAIYVLT